MARAPRPKPARSTPKPRGRPAAPKPRAKPATPKPRAKPATPKPRAKPATPKRRVRPTRATPPVAVAAGVARDQLERAMRSYADGNYPIAELRHVRCRCGGDVFTVSADDEQGVAERTCVACRHAQRMLDSDEHWDAAEPETCTCRCARTQFRVAAGFAHYAASTDIRWVYIGLACVRCALAGVYVDWKIDYGPSRQLVDQA